MCTSEKEERRVKEGDLCCGRTWSETWTRRRGCVFANVDAVLKLPLMKLFRSSGGWNGEGMAAEGER